MSSYNWDMNIGVDIDGVLAKVHEWCLEHVTAYFAKRGKSIVDINSYSTAGMFGVSKAEADKYWDDAIWDYAVDVQPMERASETLTKLRLEGHKVIINTARWLSERTDEKGERMRAIVIDWLAKHNIPYDDIAFKGEGKDFVAKQFNLDIHIDDAPHEIELLTPHLPVIIFDAPYNQSCNPPNTYRARNWEEVYKLLCSMS